MPFSAPFHEDDDNWISSTHGLFQHLIVINPFIAHILKKSDSQGKASAQVHFIRLGLARLLSLNPLAGYRPSSTANLDPPSPPPGHSTPQSATQTFCVGVPSADAHAAIFATVYACVCVYAM